MSAENEKNVNATPVGGTDEELANENEQPSIPLEGERPADNHKWYVIHTMSGHEDKVYRNLVRGRETENLTEYISEILIPTENVSVVKGGKKSIRSRKFFPGYVLLRMELTDDVWYFVKNTNGVLGFVGSKPVPLRNSEINEILGQLEEKKEKVKPKIHFEIGEVLKVNDGPFENFSGTVEETYPDKGKLKIMVSIFGRLTPVELEYWQVERA